MTTNEKKRAGVLLKKMVGNNLVIITKNKLPKAQQPFISFVKKPQLGTLPAGFSHALTNKLDREANIADPQNL